MKRQDIEDIFHPRAIAIVGASSDINRGASLFLKALLRIGYEGAIYPVNPNVREAYGLKTYPSLRNIPGPVDHVIVGVPAHLAPTIVADAVAKGARSLHFFTSGFAETATATGRALQERIAAIAHGRIRIIGPNCMGIYYPKMKICFADDQVATAGTAAFVSQSGGLATYFARNAIQEGNFCSKVISIGNSSDLHLSDFLEYFAEDSETETISMYIEGLANGEGQSFLAALATATPHKPVLIWKGGKSEQGARAALGHTGAMASDTRLWQTVPRQFGATLVDSIEEMQDFIKLHRMTPPPAGTRCCVVTFGGGSSVATSDICAQVGIILPPLTQETQEALAEFIPPMGTIRTNPVDVSMSGWQPGTLARSLAIVAADPGVDAVIFATQLGFIAGSKEHFGVSPHEILDFQAREIAAAREQIAVPLVCNNPIAYEDLALEDLRLHFKKTLASNGIPAILTMERTALALKRYYEWHRFATQRATLNGGNCSTE